MGMNAQVWRRHANPLSVWSRFTILPLFALAVWSRVWIGEGAWLLVIAVLIWTWANPRIFAETDRLENWASRVVLGERVYLQHGTDVARHHHICLRVLMLLTVPAMLVMAWGLWRLDLVATLTGTALTMIMKLWSVDRMVWIYFDFLAADPTRKHGDV